MSVFEKSKWIWSSQDECADQYAEFCDSFAYSGGEAVVYISADSDYALFVNGRYAASNQYGDFEHYKIYDEIDVTEYLNDGNNYIRILAYHCGVPTSRYRPAKAGVIYSVTCGGTLAAYSSERTLSRLCPAYESGKQLFVSVQLGFTFTYDATKENDTGYAQSAVIDKTCRFFPRPIKKHLLGERKKMLSVTRLDSHRLLVDLGGECVGLPCLELTSCTEQTVTVAWGEHIADGSVRKQIGKRNFYFEYKTKKGKNLFTEYLLRIGCRYLEIESPEPITLEYLGVIPQVYPVKERSVSVSGELEQRIYGISLNTLRLCMMEHYVDCPWREQALYAFDSRNQMLCGYYAFADKNAEYARANLRLIGEDRRDDGLLSICYPCGVDAAIPSFSLYYIVAMKEYIEHTGDTSLASMLLAKLESIIDTFLNNEKNGIIEKFSADGMWNFYDWSEYSDGSVRKYGAFATDLAINCLVAIALDSLEYICARIGKDFRYASRADSVRASIRERFLCENGLYTMHEGEEHFTVIGNTLALLSGAVRQGEAQTVCDAIVSGRLVDCSLSMKALEYDALLAVNKERYTPFILDSIAQNYKKMLDADSDTVWETAKGEADFANAGSLCHGWSAVPIYFYHKLGLAKES